MRSAIVLVTFCFAAAASFAQTLGGSLRGVVEDSRGAHIPSATVTARLHASSITRTASCDNHGGFRMDDLPPGLYTVTVTAQGFANAVADLPIEISSVRDINVTMKPPVV